VRFKQGDLISGRYSIQIIKCLDAKPVSELYLGFLQGMEVKVLIKVQRCDLIQREFELLNAIRHPGVLRVLDFIMDSDYAYVLMPYYEGESLEQVVSQHGAMAEEKVLKIAKELSGILVFLQEREKPILHNDIKPSNILWKEDGSIVLLDFGLANYEGQKQGDVLFQGTLGYAAPECWHQKEVPLTKATDVFAFGATIYRLLTGEKPNEHYGDFRLPEAHLHRRWQHIISKCCALEAKDRYQNATQIFDRLSQISFF